MDRRERDEDGDASPVLAQQIRLERGHALALSDALCHFDVGLPVGGDEQGRTPAPDLFRLVSQKSLCGVVPIRDATVGRLGDDRIVRRFDDGSEPAAHFLSAMPLRDVSESDDEPIDLAVAQDGRSRHFRGERRAILPRQDRFVSSRRLSCEGRLRDGAFDLGGPLPMGMDTVVHALAKEIRQCPAKHPLASRIEVGQLPGRRLSQESLLRRVDDGPLAPAAVHRLARDDIGHIGVALGGHGCERGDQVLVGKVPDRGKVVASPHDLPVGPLEPDVAHGA